MSALTLYPAIDLLGGRVVRLHKGNRAEATVYSDDVAAVARSFREQGARWIHIVDLDAAFDGPLARQVDAIAAIVKNAPGIPLQLGGGLRELSTIAAVLDQGISRVLIGTAAVENRPILREALKQFGPEKIAVAVDEADGFVKTRGWVSGPGGLKAAAFARELAQEGVRWFLHSAIKRDGTLSGPDVAALREVSAAVADLGGKTICAGGIGTLDHLTALRTASIAGLEGAVAGRALYEKAFAIPAGIAALAGTP